MKQPAPQNQWIHSVYFWLDRNLPLSKRKAFRKELLALEKIPAVRQIAVGGPAPSDRPAVDGTYDFALMTVFDGLEGHRAYQDHPRHKAFVEGHRSLWKKVVIYDFQTHSAEKAGA